MVVPITGLQSRPTTESDGTFIPNLLAASCAAEFAPDTIDLPSKINQTCTSIQKGKIDIQHWTALPVGQVGPLGTLGTLGSPSRRPGPPGPLGLPEPLGPPEPLGLLGPLPGLPCSGPMGLGIAATKAAREATAKRVSLENMVKKRVK